MTTESALLFATGPLFRFCLVIMTLGTLRLLWNAFLGIASSGRNGSGGPLTGALRETAEWVFPGRSLLGTRPVFSVLSLVFHLGMVAVILFHQDHLLVLRRIAGPPWPSIHRIVADVLAFTSILTGISLLCFRIINRVARNVSTVSDYAMLGAVTAAMLSGFIASRPWNPVPHDTSVLFHTLMGNLILLLLPYTRLSHAVLYPFLRLATAAAWRFPSRVKAVKR